MIADGNQEVLREIAEDPSTGLVNLFYSGTLQLTTHSLLKTIDRLADVDDDDDSLHEHTSYREAWQLADRLVVAAYRPCRRRCYRFYSSTHSLRCAFLTLNTHMTTINRITRP